MKRLFLALLAFVSCAQAALALPASGIPTKFPLYWGQDAGGAYIRPIPASSQIGIQNGAASLHDGFPPLTFTPIEAGGVPPFGQDMNGILAQISQWSQWQNAGGCVPFDNTFSGQVNGYPKNAILCAANAGNFWLNTLDNNVANPDTGGGNWLGFSPWYMYSTDTGSANAGTVTLPITISALAGIQGRPLTVKKVASANTSAYSLTVNTFMANVVHMDGTAIASGDLAASSMFTVIYDGTYFRMQSPVVQPTLGTAAAKNVSNNADPVVASVCSGGVINTHSVEFQDNNGTVCDSGFVSGPSALAKATYTVSGSTLTGSYNFASGVKNTTGNYTFTFTSALSSTAYQVLDTIVRSIGGNITCGTESKSTTSFTVQCNNVTSGSPTDPDGLDIAVF